MFSSDDGEDDLHDLRERAAIVFVIVSEKPADDFRSTQAAISTAWWRRRRPTSSTWRAPS